MSNIIHLCYWQLLHLRATIGKLIGILIECAHIRDYGFNG